MQLFAIQKRSSNIFFSIVEENKVTHKIFEYIHQPPVTMHLFKSPAQVHIDSSCSANGCIMIGSKKRRPEMCRCPSRNVFSI